MKALLALISIVALAAGIYFASTQQSSSDTSQQLELKLKQQELLHKQLQTKLSDQELLKQQALSELEKAKDKLEQQKAQTTEQAAIAEAPAEMLAEDPVQEYPSSQLTPFEHETQISSAIYEFNADHNNSTIDELTCGYESCQLKLSINAGKQSNPQLAAFMRHMSENSDYEVHLSNMRNTANGLVSEFSIEL